MVSSVACHQFLEGRQGLGEGKKHKPPTTEQVNSGNSAQSVLGVSFSRELCQVALVTVHGDGVELAQGPDAPALLDGASWCQ